MKNIKAYSNNDKFYNEISQFILIIILFTVLGIAGLIIFNNSNVVKEYSFTNDVYKLKSELIDVDEKSNNKNSNYNGLKFNRIKTKSKEIKNYIEFNDIDGDKIEISGLVSGLVSGSIHALHVIEFNDFFFLEKKKRILKMLIIQKILM